MIKLISAEKVLFCLCLMLFSVNLRASSIDDLAGDLQKGLKGKGKKIAVLEFSYADGKQSAGGKIIQERIITAFSKNRRFTLIERSLLEKVMKELNLSHSGIVDKKDIKKIGEISGADWLLLGTLNDVKKGKTEVNARVVVARTAEILSAADCLVEKTWKDSVAGDDTQPDYSGKPLVQIAMLLDTSNSMDGLIEQAKNQLWTIINEVSSGEKNRNAPKIEVALYEYGNSSLKKEENYLRRVLPFTSDMDLFAKKLYSLKTNGGNEYCGAVLSRALNELKWSKKDDVYRAIFIAGNEPFTQGPVDFRVPVAKAKRMGIFVNTIFCGNKQAGMGMQWKKAAVLAGGEYTNIDQTLRRFVAQTPYDDEITALNNKLNRTYLPYGRGGERRLKEKKEMDTLSFSSGGKGVMAARAAAKAREDSATLSSWDLISAVESGSMKFGDIKKENLPVELKKMSRSELQNYIDRKIAERKKVKEKIIQLQKKRKSYLAKKERESSSTTLGSAMIKFIRKQAESKGFKFSK